MANNYPQVILKFVMDAIFPVRCIGCGTYDMYLCDSCLTGIEIKNDSEMVGNLQIFSAADYRNPLVEKALKVFKYGFIKDMTGPVFSTIRHYIDNLSDNLGLFDGNPLLVPVPLSRKRLNWRGFNQSEILADKIAEHYGLEIGREILARTKDIKPQADIKDRENRLGNIVGAFECRGALRKRNIILIDDICTTGATLNECAKVLAANGAGKIKALVVARG